jgi:integrase
MEKMRRDWALSPTERTDAREALAILEGSGLTLKDAATRATAGLRALRRVTVRQACDQYLRAKLKEIRSTTYGFYETKLKVFCDQFGEVEMDAVTRQAFRSWLDGLNSTSSSTRAGYVRSCRALWSWSRGQEPPLAAHDPTSGVRTVADPREGGASILTVDEAAAVLAAAGEYRSTVALLLFAGLRPDEPAGRGKPPMLWQSINVAEKMIRVPAECAKTGRARVIEGLPPALWAWLMPGAVDERICPVFSSRAVKRAAGAISRPWPADCMRHSFATYALAMTADPGRVSMWLGHEGNPTMLHRHYRGLATKAEAESFFALRP